MYKIRVFYNQYKEHTLTVNLTVNNIYVQRYTFPSTLSITVSVSFEVCMPFIFQKYLIWFMVYNHNSFKLLYILYAVCILLCNLESHVFVSFMITVH